MFSSCDLGQSSVLVGALPVNGLLSKEQLLLPLLLALETLAALPAPLLRGHTVSPCVGTRAGYLPFGE
jgi:hypothetical protein